ncbi:calcium/sodium antiporter [Exilibacterium tricleocarpae]|uniref:Calcium/sodium antiporter n=1 Tax=Exilibacterium tricleocarpae TaxID=2591008 RepID=A0A545TSJ5_9GAMM|nr:calcium/sodium antiporter [Exilibacterium tricleocarpae]TQV80179.1 calcium/sodium antiporter [Exilibacterium tricleocarpae]
MSEVWLAGGAVLAGFVGLVWSADRFVAGSAAFAHNFGVAKLTIGLTIVSLGTSAPEIAVAISAALEAAGDMAIGNAIGSNIANIGLVLAVTALIAPLPIQRHLLTQEMPILLVVTLIAGIMLYDAKLGRWEGIVLLAVLFPLMYYLVKVKQRGLSDTEQMEESEDIPEMTNVAAVLWFAAGLVLLIISSNVLVWGAETLALSFGVSTLVIGLTVVAVGTSLPELAASAISALKGHHDIALGNIIGSNIFNLLAVMAMPGIIAPAAMEAAVFFRDFAAMALITLLLALAIAGALWLAGRSQLGRARLGRSVGAALLIGYISYYIVLFNP